MHLRAGICGGQMPKMTKEITLEPHVYDMGMGASIPIALFTMIYHTDEIRKEIYIEVFIDLIKRFYMDDYQNIMNTVQTGDNRQRNMLKAMKSGVLICQNDNLITQNLMTILIRYRRIGNRK